MNAAQQLNKIGQSLWLDNITRDLLKSGTLAKYIKDWAVTGLTSNPSIFNLAIGKSADYDDDIHALLKKGKVSEDLFFELAKSDLAQAAELFRPIYDRTDGVDGWVSLEVSPLLAYDTKSTIDTAKKLHAQANSAQPVHQDPRDSRRHPGHRGGDLRGRPGQCDATLLA